jgi:hypothetical protein
MVESPVQYVLGHDAEEAETPEELGRYIDKFTDALANASLEGAADADATKLLQAQKLANKLKNGEIGLDEGLKRWKNGDGGEEGER